MSALFDVQTPLGTARFSNIGGQLIQLTLENGQEVFLNQNRDTFVDSVSFLEDYLPFSGCPLSSPWFGQMAANPKNVQSSFAQVETRPVHGLVRNLLWTYLGTKTNGHSVRVRFELPPIALSSMQSISLYWQMEYVFSRSSLTVLVTTKNMGQDTLTISQGLHNYFALECLDNHHLHGLENVRGWDAEKQWQPFSPLSDAIPLKPMDWVLDKVNKPIRWTGKQGLCLTMELIDCQNLVLWNPGANHPLTAKYWHEGEWSTFFCIEPSQLLDNAPTLQKNQMNTFGYTLIFA